MIDVEKYFRAAKHLSNDQMVAIIDTTNAFVSVANIVNFLPEIREKSLCMTKLQEAKFWAIECIAKNNPECIAED